MSRCLTLLLYLLLPPALFAQETAASCSTTSLYGQVVSSNSRIPLPKTSAIQVLAKREVSKEVLDKEETYDSWFCVKVPMYAQVFLLFQGVGFDPYRTKTIDTNIARKRHSWSMNAISLYPVEGSSVGQSADPSEKQRLLRERLARHKDSVEPGESNDLFAWNIELYRDEYRQDPTMLAVIDEFLVELTADSQYTFLNDPAFQKRTSLFRAIITLNKGLEWDRRFDSSEVIPLIRDADISAGIRVSAIGALALLGKERLADKDMIISLLTETLDQDSPIPVKVKSIEGLSAFSENEKALTAIRRAADKDESDDVKLFASSSIKRIEGTSSRVNEKLAINTVRPGERVNSKGIVVKRHADSFIMSEAKGGQIEVVLTANTDVKIHTLGVFRGSPEYGATYILRGLRLEVEGVSDSEGRILADKIRFEEQDLRTAQALKSTTDPAEAELLAKLLSQQQEQERLAAQINQLQADYANNRITGLDDFDPIKTITIDFKAGSARLEPHAKTKIDNAAAWIKTQNTQRWVMTVVGYADSTGNSARNRDLSERRANAVIYYLVSKYKLPLNRLVQPFGYGQLEAVAENRIGAGRAKNRTVEIRLMVNKRIGESTP